MDYYKEALRLHEEKQGKLSIVSKVSLENKDDLSIAYTPGVAKPCIEISKNPEDVYKYTSKGNMVAIVTDGSAVLGLGNIGAKASIPVMEGKAVLFKAFANVDAIPICTETQDTEEIISVVKNISPFFGGINLEDISAPRCFDIERRLQEALDIPVFHDDQHGTAIVTSAAVINALKLVKKKMKEVKIVVNGAGAAGSAIVKMLIVMGAKNILICDRQGIISKKRKGQLSQDKIRLAELTNQEARTGGLTDAIQSADIFIGVSSPKTVTYEMIKNMNKDAIVFAMSNPEPEVIPDIAFEAGARIVGTGRSDFANQINNVLAFPGIFKGALASRAKKITEPMKVAAAYAIAKAVKEGQLNENYIIPSVFQEGIADDVADAVANAWYKEAGTE